MATVNYQSSCSLKKQSTETSQQMSRRILLYFNAREGLVDDGLCPKGNIVCVALEEPALCQTIRGTGTLIHAKELYQLTLILVCDKKGENIVKNQGLLILFYRK